MTLENFTTGIATASVTSPWWLPSLATVSSFAALLLPIFGTIWLIIQITYKLSGK